MPAKVEYDYNNSVFVIHREPLTVPSKIECIKQVREMFPGLPLQMAYDIVQAAQVRAELARNPIDDPYGFEDEEF